MFAPSNFSYADAGGAQQGIPAVFGPTLSSVVVNDGGGTDWEVYANGSVKAVRSTSYPSVVGVLQPAGASKTQQILANLSAVSVSNAQRIEAVVGSTAAQSLPAPKFESAAPLPLTASGAPAVAAKTELKPAGALAGEPVPLTEQVWFWPVVILSGTLLVSGGVYAYSRYRKSRA